MAHFSTAIHINASPERVFAILRDVERWPEWTSTTTSVKRLDAGPFTVGSRALVCQPKLRPTEWQVAELNEGRNFTWVARHPGLRIIGRHEIQADSGGTSVTLSLEFSGLLGALIGRFYQGLNERYLAMEAKGLRDRCEAST